MRCRHCLLAALVAGLLILLGGCVAAEQNGYSEHLNTIVLPQPS